MTTVPSAISVVQNMAVDLRAYKFIRSFAIKNLYDAVTELITNCDDAYRRLDVPRKIMVNYYITADHREYLEVIDNAIGIAPEQMESCLLTAGAFTNIENARGFFSTGAKNICVLGKITFRFSS